MKVKTLIKTVALTENIIKSIEIYFGLFSESNLIMKINDINDITFSEINLLIFIGENEEVNSFSYENQTLSISIK